MSSEKNAKQSKRDAKASKKDAKAAKGSKGRAGDASVDPDSAGAPSVAAHPRASRRVRQARELAGLVGFLLAGWLSLPTHTALQAGLGALGCGVACYVLVWAVAVLIWRQLVLAELEDREQALLAAHLEARTQAGAPGAPGAPAGRSRQRQAG